MNILLLQSHASLPGNEFIRRWYIASRRIRIYRGPLVSTFLSFHIYFPFSPFLFPSFFLLPLSMLYFFFHLCRSSPRGSIIRSAEPQDYSFDRDSAGIYRGWIEIKKEHPVNSWSTSRIASRGGCSLFHGLVRLAGLWNQVFLEGKTLVYSQARLLVSKEIIVCIIWSKLLFIIYLFLIERFRSNM